MNPKTLGIYFERELDSAGARQHYIEAPRRDWRGFFARYVGSPMIERNDSVGFATDETFFRGKWRAAGDYQDLTAVNLLKMSVS